MPYHLGFEGVREDGVEVKLPLPKIVSKKDIAVQVTPTHLSIKLLVSAEAVMEGKLFARVKSDETNWYFGDDRVLRVTLTKQVAKNWKLLWDPASKKDD